MYKGTSYFPKWKEKRSRAGRRLALLLLVAAGLAGAGAGGIFLFLYGRAMAAPEGGEGTVAYSRVVKQPLPLSVQAPVPEQLKEEKTAPVIFLDPGHGGEDEGCARGGILEKDVNLSIAVLVRERLEDMGFEVHMPREGDSYVSKEERVEKANELDADIYVSIHQNAYDDTSVSGIETWYDSKDGCKDSGRLARLLHQETLQRTEAVAREAKDGAEFYVTGKTEMPACLIETGFLSNAEERERLATAEYQEKLAEGIARGIELYFRPKTMYLTFDDGPCPDTTNQILDILKDRNIKATFFVIGENVRRNPEVAKRIVEEGHMIGIHCDSHDYKVIYGSVESYVQDFERAYATVKEITGVEAKLYRFPGGSVNAYNSRVRKAIAEEMDRRGFVYFDWNASLEDAVSAPQKEDLISNARGTLLGREKVVMLAHDTVQATADFLGDILDILPEYKMEPLTWEVEPIQFRMDG